MPGLAGIDLSRVLMIAREQQLAGKIHACALPRKQPGIMDGCTATKYCPDDTKTRGQMPVFVVRGLLDP
ncbi:MAG: hypothetical protein LC126_19320 [Bryobacterales bacterium]|nr:hypothetical protein [Bryobacterales bacterium]